MGVALFQLSFDHGVEIKRERARPGVAVRVESSNGHQSIEREGSLMVVDSGGSSSNRVKWTKRNVGLTKSPFSPLSLLTRAPSVVYPLINVDQPCSKLANRRGTIEPMHRLFLINGPGDLFNALTRFSFCLLPSVRFDTGFTRGDMFA